MEFLTNILRNILMNILTYYLLTVASFRIGVPSILFFQVVWMLFNLSGELSKAYRRYRIKKDKKRNFVIEALKITFLNYGPHWGCWIIFLLLITYTVSLQRVLSVFLAFVILMEVLQFWLYPSRHFKFIENWIELFIILLSK